MGNFTKSVFIVVLLSQFIRCSEQEPEKLKGRIEFGIDLSVPGNGRQMTLPDNARVSFDLLNVNGETITRELDLLTIGNGYVTSPLELATGEYSLKKFMVLAGSNAIYVAPLEGSPLAALVKKPLPLTFQVVKDQVLNLVVEVVSAEEKQPEDFGYASFGIEVVQTSGINLGVFVDDGNELSFTDAQVYLLRQNDTLINKHVSPEVNDIFFTEDSTAVFTLVITKSGYGKFSRELSLHQLAEELLGKPLAVVLPPALTFVTGSLDVNNHFEFGIFGASHIVIDWGDGLVESRDLNGFTSNGHEYEAHKPYFVSVTGDIEAVLIAYFYYGNAPTTEINLTQLTGLQEMRMGFTQSPGVIDLTHNKALEYLDITSNDTRKIMLAENTNLSGIDISYNDYSTDEVDQLIDAVFSNVTANNITYGFFNMGDDPDHGPVGPPSNEATEQLKRLVSSYGWNVWPSPNGTPSERHRYVSKYAAGRALSRLRLGESLERLDL